MEVVASDSFSNAVETGGLTADGCVPRVLALSSTHVLELSPGGDRILFRRPITDIAAVCVRGLVDHCTGHDAEPSPQVGELSLVFASDGLEKRFVCLPASTMHCGLHGAAVLASGDPVFPGLALWTPAHCPPLGKGVCSAGLVAEVVASTLLSCGRALGWDIDLLSRVGTCGGHAVPLTSSFLGDAAVPCCTCLWGAHPCAVSSRFCGNRVPSI